MAVDANDFRPADSDNNLLRKILARLKTGIVVGGAGVTLEAGDIEIGAVELKNGTDDTRAKISGSAPGGSDNGLIVRNIPSGTQAVSVGDGSNVSQGAVADAAVTNPALSGSIIALLKGVITKLAGSLTVTGPVTDAQLRASAVPGSVADGSDVTQGAKADAAVTNPASSGSVVAFLKGILTALQGSLAVTITAGLKVISTNFTRPNDSNAYAASDVVNDNTSAGSAHVITFASVANAVGGVGYITKARLEVNSATVTNALFRLYIYNTAPTALGDNAAFTLLDANKATRLGYVDFALSTEGAGSDCAEAIVTGVNLPFKCAVADTGLYGVLVAKGAYVPTANAVFTVELSADLN